MDGLLSMFEEQFKKGEPYRDAFRGLLRGDTAGWNKLNAPSLADPQEAVDIATGFAGTIKPVQRKVFEEAFNLAQQRAALPVSEGGLGLPANNTAMDRAKAMGYTTKGYTGAVEDIRIADVNKSKGKSSDTGIWFTDSPDRANTYAGSFSGGNVTPALLNQGNTLTVEAASKNWNRLGPQTKVSAPKITVIDSQDVDLLNQLGISAAPKEITKKSINKTLKKMFPDDFKWDDYFTTDDLARFGRREGYDSSQFSNVVDTGPYGLMVNEASTLPATNYVIYKPKNVRSVNAAFDPFRRNEPDILAGVAAAPAGLLAIDKEKPKKKRSNK